MSAEKINTIIIGGGPAGLTAAYELSKNNIPCLLLEQGDKLGGLARTENYKGYYFDLGGHRFFSKALEINRLWDEVMGKELLIRSRLSRIYYDKKFFNYPIRPLNALSGLGLGESIRIVASYIKQRFWPYREEKSFEQWVANRFGQRLFEIFFKSYTEKVWGLSCKEIGADWAAQRIKGLSFTTAIVDAFLGEGKSKIKTLIKEFKYPKYGPGMMWEAMAKKIRSAGGEIMLGNRVNKIIRRAGLTQRIVVENGQEFAAEQIISSLPLTNLVASLEPPPPEEIILAAEKLSYRSFLIVALIFDREAMFPDNWIYVHTPGVKLGRIQNFKNWSPYMVPDPQTTCLGLEYFCNENDGLWNSNDQELIKLGSKELSLIGLTGQNDRVLDGVVLRLSHAYPIYNDDYSAAVAKIRSYLADNPHLQTIGRSGMHRYNNMDHSMLTGLYAARNILSGKLTHDLWSVNADGTYLEG